MPNVLLIMTDNQQASTLGCYGNREIYTPNLDRFASEAIVFDNAYCPNAFCSPCRASLLTGLMPSQHGVHSWIDDRSMKDWPVGWHALDGLSTLPQLVKEAGYATALIGKYHLGDPVTPMPGFDHWVTLEDGHVRSFQHNRIFDNGDSYLHEGSSVDFFTDKALTYLDQQASATQPFFLFLAYPAPYGHWPATKETISSRHTERYADCPMDTAPRMGLSAEAVAGYDMKKAYSGHGLDYSMLVRAPNDLATLRNYYAQISTIDDGVGALLAKLKALNLYDDTLVIFTADHGLSIGHHGFWGHGGATFPSNLHHAAHSIPLIIRQGNTFGQGVRSSRMVSNMDLFSTTLDALKIERGEQKPSLPSRSLVPILTGNNAPQLDEDVVYSEQEETRVVRTPKWAFFRRFDGAGNYPIGDELYDVEHDPGETKNLIANPCYANVRETLSTMLDAFFAAHSVAEADLWTGGMPIQNSERKPFWQDAWGPNWGPVYRYNKN